MQKKSTKNTRKHKTFKETTLEKSETKNTFNYKRYWKGREEEKEHSKW